MSREVVECCPFDDTENTYNWNGQYIATCKECGKLIFLCDACMESDDFVCCDWHETDDGRECCRGFIKEGM